MDFKLTCLVLAIFLGGGAMAAGDDWWSSPRSVDSVTVTLFPDEEVAGLSEIMHTHRTALEVLADDDWSSRQDQYQRTRAKLDSLLHQYQPVTAVTVLWPQ